jgi:hypothetical protein
MQTKNVARAVMRFGCTTKICPEVPLPFPYKFREQNTVDVDQDHSAATPQKIKIGSGPLALPPFNASSANVQSLPQSARPAGEKEAV